VGQRDNPRGRPRRQAGRSYSLVKQPKANASPPGLLHFRAPGVALSLFPSPSRARDMERREAPGASARRPGGLARSARCAADKTAHAPQIAKGQAPPRRSILALSVPGAACSCSGICAEARTDASQPGRSARPAVSRTSRARGYEPRPQDARSRSVFRIASRTRPLIERDTRL
jgi:hypothetical protein